MRESSNNNQTYCFFTENQYLTILNCECKHIEFVNHNCKMCSIPCLHCVHSIEVKQEKECRATQWSGKIKKKQRKKIKKDNDLLCECQGIIKSNNISLLWIRKII